MQAGGVYLCANEIAITNLLDASLCAKYKFNNNYDLIKEAALLKTSVYLSVAGTVYIYVSGNELVRAAFALANGMVATSWTVFHCELT